MISIAADFAARHVAVRPDLSACDEFPEEIWRNMGKAGLFKIGIDESYGGSGGGYLHLSQAAEAFVRNGFNPGLAVSWTYQQILARFIVSKFGTAEQLSKYLPALADGKLVLSFAVSEPEHGANPKKLSTKALRRETGFELSGEKTYLTNGPLADIFIVVAVTDEKTVRRQFTAFFVPRTAEGLTVMPQLRLNFLKPSIHGGVKLENCRLKHSDILGGFGTAWTDMVVPLGEIEDVVMMGPALGAMSAQLDMLIEALQSTPQSSEQDLQSEIGNLHAWLSGMRIIACEAARLLDLSSKSPADLVILFAQMMASSQAAAASCANRWSPDSRPEYKALQQDLTSLMMFRQRVAKIRQKKIGAALLKS